MISAYSHSLDLCRFYDERTGDIDMGVKGFVFVLVCIFICRLATAQAYLKTEYIASSGFRDENNRKVGGSGSACIVQGGFSVPLSIRMDENKRPTAWTLGLNVAYADLNNKNLSDDLTLSGIFNTQIGLSYLRPLNSRWSIMAMVGAGLYTETAGFNKTYLKNILGEGMVVFIWHLLDDLDVGMGVAVNTAFGYPMTFPAFLLNWKLEGRYFVTISMMNMGEFEAGMALNESLQLKLVAGMNGMLALVNRDGKKKMFTEQYITTGVQPEFVLSKSLSIPLTVGISAYRAAFYDDRTLRAFFKSMSRDYDPHFSPSFYISAGIKYGF